MMITGLNLTYTEVRWVYIWYVMCILPEAEMCGVVYCLLSF